MPQSKHAPPRETGDVVDAAPPRSGYLIGAAVTIFSLVIGALLTNLLVDDPRARADAFAATVHAFNRDEDAARAEFAVAADTQRDATAALMHAMVGGAPAASVAPLADRLKATSEVYERAGMRLQALERNYGPIFGSDDRPAAIHDLGIKLEQLTAYQQDDITAAGFFKKCLLETANAYAGALPSADANPAQIRCKRGKVVYLLYDAARADGGIDQEENGEFARLDYCEYGIETALDSIAGLLSIAVETSGSSDGLLSDPVGWFDRRYRPRPAPAPVMRPPDKRTVDHWCRGTADIEHHTMLPPADPGPLGTFHPHPVPAGGEALAP